MDDLAKKRAEKNFLDSVLPELQCHLFPGRADPGVAHLEINNATYLHWRKIWGEILKLPPGTPLPSDNFLRQAQVCSITHGGEVIGMIAASFFPWAQLAFRDHSYLQPFLSAPDFIAATERGGSLMSIEYLSVDPRFRKGELGISLGSVLLGLGMEIFDVSGSQFVLGTARSKIHVDEMCYSFGFSPCGEMEKYGHPCTLILNSRATLIRHPDALVSRVVDLLWRKKRDYFQTENKPLRIAA